jgi:hypothetical protein
MYPRAFYTGCRRPLGCAGVDDGVEEELERPVRLRPLKYLRPEQEHATLA